MDSEVTASELLWSPLPVPPSRQTSDIYPSSSTWADFDDELRDRSQRRWARVWEVLLVLAITAIGAGLRFMMLDRPAIWGDESATYARVCSTYADLVSQLHDWGFVPLHYELYWWFRTWLLAHGRMMGPELLRLPVAICSALTVPAMYLLARQLIGRSGALAVALITATSAYMLVYAHDAKMYADSWLFCVLAMAAFLWWMRQHSIMAWLAWIAAGAIAAGIHAPGLALLGVQLVWLIVQREHRWWRTLLFIAGAAIIAAGPAYYYESFTRWGQHIESEGWGASGLDWVNRYNETRTGPDLVRFTATAYLFGWEWPASNTIDDVEPKVLDLCEHLSEAVLALLIMGMFPWPTRRRFRALAADPPSPVATISPDEPHWKMIAGWHRLMRAAGPVAWWRSAIWIAVWIIVPTYGLYVASPPALNIEPGKPAAGVSPAYWFVSTWDWLANPWNAAIALATVIAAFYCCAPSWRGRIVRTLQMLGVMSVPIAMCFGIRALLVVQSPGSIWMPRYLGFIWPGVAIAGVVLLLRLPSAPLRWAAIGFVVAMNVVNGVERMVQYTEPPMAAIVKDLYDAHESHGQVTTICDFTRGGADPGAQAADSSPARYYALVYGKTQIKPGVFWAWNFEPNLSQWTYPHDTQPAAVADMVRDDPAGDRLIVWHAHNEAAALEDYSQDLGPSWKRVFAKQYHLFTYWNWNQQRWLDRQEFVRLK